MRPARRHRPLLHISRSFLALWTLTLLGGFPQPPFSGGIQAQGAEQFRASTRPYGIAFDGSNFWFTDVRSRRVHRMTADGRSRSFFLGNFRLYGLAFNPRDGMIYVCSRRKIIKVNPVTGGRQEIVRIPVRRAAGIAFGVNVWYILEKGNGRIHAFDPRLGRTIETIETSYPDLRDIAIYRGNIWVSDGKHGIIYRYRITSKELTGAVSGPIKKLRGLCFRDSQLWIVNRKLKTLQRLPYSETEQYIISGEQKYIVSVEVSFVVKPGMAGHVLVLQPPVSISQRPLGARTKTPGWKGNTYTASGQRAFSMRISRARPGRKTLRFEYRLTARNARYLVPASFKGKREELESSPAFFYTDQSASAFNEGDPYRALLPFIKQETVSRAGVIQLVNQLRGAGLPARWVQYAEVRSDGTASAPFFRAEVYLRGYGWLPLNRGPAADRGDGKARTRMFARPARWIALARMPDMQTRGLGLVFHVRRRRAAGARRMDAINAEVKLQVRRR